MGQLRPGRERPNTINTFSKSQFSLALLKEKRKRVRKVRMYIKHGNIISGRERRKKKSWSCSCQHFSPQPKLGSNLCSTNGWMNKENVTHTHTHTHTRMHAHVCAMEYYSAMQKKELLPFATSWGDLMKALCQVKQARQRKTKTIQFHLHMASKRNWTHRYREQTGGCKGWGGRV